MARREPLSRTVKAAGWVSLFNDIATEMAYPLLPLFLTSVLGASPALLGFVDGVADTVGALLKLFSGRLSDRLGRRKALVALGYGISGLSKPLFSIVLSPWQFLILKVTDRCGKGLRTAPRDALVADAVEPRHYARAYGFNRAMDNSGACLGPLIAWFALQHWHMSLRGFFAWTALPGLVAFLVVLFFVKEGLGASKSKLEKVPGLTAKLSLPGLRPLLLATSLFTLASASDSFLLLRAQQLGVGAAFIPLLWAAHNGMRALWSYPAGLLADRIGRRRMVIAGWALYASVYVGFALARGPWQIAGLFVIYGLFYALSEGATNALIAELAPSHERGRLFGSFGLVNGLMLLPASWLFGFIAGRAGYPPALIVSGSFAAAATLVLLFTRKRRA